MLNLSVLNVFDPVLHDLIGFTMSAVPAPNTSSNLPCLEASLSSVMYTRLSDTCQPWGTSRS
ncbi:hypothetical protein TMatcc_008139 [Talaromyces marneffei ATCC 18224]